ADELGTDGSFNAQVALGPDALDGTVVNVNGVNYTVTVDDVLTNDSTPALTGTVNDPTATVVVNVDGVDYPAVNNGSPETISTPGRKTSTDAPAISTILVSPS
ncbi:hypothetical protein ACSRDE_19160, partial [Acinetobacter baumannii]|uniref:hypothetical protein n=1 Tax=Acinetobacter baumannii TaxID=470 RepID=UPI003ED89460